MKRHSIALVAALATGMSVSAVRRIEDEEAEAPSPKAQPEPRPRVASQLNRWTGEPHKHSREIARRARQKARAEAKRIAQLERGS